MERRKTSGKKENEEKESAGDLMDALMKTKDIEGKHLKDEEVLDNVVNSILLGHISSAYSVTWCHYFLAKSPTVLQKVRVSYSLVTYFTLLIHAFIKSYFLLKFIYVYLYFCH